jgi:hypothetical protein
MAFRISNKPRAYGIGSPLIDLAPRPILALRPPTISDSGEIGTVWIDQNANTFYFLTSVVAGQAHWSTAPAVSITITGNTGGPLTGSSFTFHGGSTGLSFGGSGSTETLTFAGITANGGTVNLATDATASTLNIGTGAGAKTLNLGSTNTTSTTTINSGSGGINMPQFTEGALVTSSSGKLSSVDGTAGFVLTANAPGTAPSFQAATGGGITITGDTGGPITSASFTLAGGTTGLEFNGAGTTETLSFSGITANGGAVALSTDAVLGSVDIGTGAAVKTVVIGSTNTTSSTAIHSGSGNVVLNAGLTVNSTGIMTNAQQPAFSAKQAAEETNATGDGTLATVRATAFFDQGSNYDQPSGAFTAPVTGRYFFTMAVQISHLDASFTEGFVQLTATSRSIFGNVINIGAVRAGIDAGMELSGFIDMSAGDTCLAQVTVSGGTQTLSISANSYFSGFLVC